MEFIRSHMVRVFVAVFVVIFCGEVSHKVRGVRIVRVVNIGDNITLDCNPPQDDYNNYSFWYRNGTYLANGKGFSISIDDPRINQTYMPVYTENKSLYSLSIYNANIADSASYTCYYYYVENPYYVLQYYDVRVVGCTCSLANHASPDNEKVICNLENFRAESQMRMNITINGDINKTVVIDESTFSFAILRHELYNSLQFELNPYTDAMSSIICMLPAQFTSPQPFTHYPTTSSMPTPQDRRSKASHTTSQELISGAPISTAVHHTTQTKTSNPGKNLSDITMIIAIGGSVFILILIVLIVVLRCKQTKNRQENKHNGNVSVDDKVTKEHPEACYESVADASQRGPQYATSIEEMRETSGDQPSADHLDNGGLIDNILYDSSDRLAESFISRTEGPLDNALYAMPEKKGTLNRESISEVIDGSSNADILYGNSVIISQQEQKRDTLQRGDQYENVRMPGSGAGGDAEEIPLYAMPDKGPQRNTLKATPKAGQSSTLSTDEVVDVDALYAEVDKTKKK